MKRKFSIPDYWQLKKILSWASVALCVLVLCAQGGCFGPYLKHEALTKSGLPPDSNTVTVSPAPVQKSGTTSNQLRTSKEKTEKQKASSKKVGSQKADAKKVKPKD